MARSSYGRGGGGAAPAPAPTKVDPKLKLYNMIRWMNYLLFPLLGVVVICLGIFWALFIGDEAEQNVARTLVIAGGLLAYISIFYNKR